MINHKFFKNLSSLQWFIILWIFGFITLLIIAGLFKVLLYFAY